MRGKIIYGSRDWLINQVKIQSPLLSACISCTNLYPSAYHFNHPRLICTKLTLVAFLFPSFAILCLPLNHNHNWLCLESFMMCENWKNSLNKEKRRGHTCVDFRPIKDPHLSRLVHFIFTFLPLPAARFLRHFSTSEFKESCIKCPSRAKVSYPHVLLTAL